jgi:hypothetical protein
MPLRAEQERRERADPEVRQPPALVELLSMRNERDRQCDRNGTNGTPSPAARSVLRHQPFGHDRRNPPLAIMVANAA